MDKLKIKRNTLGDTRTATKVPTIKEFQLANNDHTDDVRRMMTAIADSIRDRGCIHDYTKREEPRKSMFYRDLCNKLEGKLASFEDGEWYPMHCLTERHHLNEYCPEDVNLIDVIEMVCDCVCAGMARTGKFRPIEISSEILQKALKNTAQLCVDAVEITEK